MRRATGIGLVLLGGGVAFGLTQCDTTSEPCREARAQGLPNAEEVCRSSSRSGGSSSSSSWRGSSGSATTASARGGFGSFGGGGS
jgi:uncharacterized membrane protein YgcG